MEITALDRRYQLIFDGLQNESEDLQEKYPLALETIRSRGLNTPQNVGSLRGMVLREASSQMDLLSDAQALRMAGFNVSIVLSRTAAIAREQMSLVDQGQLGGLPLSEQSKRFDAVSVKEEPLKSTVEVSPGLEAGPAALLGSTSLYEVFKKNALGAGSSVFSDKPSSTHTIAESSTQTPGFYGAGYKNWRSGTKETSDIAAHNHPDDLSISPATGVPSSNEGFFGSQFSQKAKSSLDKQAQLQNRDLFSDVPPGSEAEQYPHEGSRAFQLLEEDDFQNLDDAIEDGASLATIQKLKREAGESSAQLANKAINYNDPKLASVLNTIEKQYGSTRQKKESNWVQTGCLFFFALLGIGMMIWFYLLLSFEPQESQQNKYKRRSPYQGYQRR